MGISANLSEPLYITDNLNIRMCFTETNEEKYVVVNYGSVQNTRNNIQNFEY